MAVKCEVIPNNDSFNSDPPLVGFERDSDGNIVITTRGNEKGGERMLVIDGDDWDAISRALAR